MPAPPRGTRPRNRRALIVAAATELFYRRGYDQLGMSDIAEAVAMGPSALYRHFAGKQDLLRTVIAEGFEPVHEVVNRLDLTDRPASLPRLATLALDHRELGVLWQREARHMRQADVDALRGDLRAIARALTSRVLLAHPRLSPAAADLHAFSTLAILMSTSFHHLDLPRPAYDELVAEIVGAALDTELAELPAAPAQPAETPRLLPNSRREALLAEAVRMFAREGYTGVGIEDIGAAVGIAGPSIYNHFPSKLDMLLTALNRGTAVLYMDLTTSLRTAADAPDALRKLVASYVQFTLRHHDIVDLLITETEQLPADERHSLRQSQHDYISEWVRLLRIIHPQYDPTAARIRVHAAITVANDAARTPHLRGNPAMAGALQALCAGILRLESRHPRRA